MICHKCNAGIVEGSKFCPQCGNPVTDKDTVSVPATEIQIANVVINFGFSTSVNYPKAIEICRKIPTYSVTGEGKQIQHEINLPITEVELIITLFDLVGSWVSSKMLLNGYKATKKDLIYHGIGCYRSRLNEPKPEEYCFGCNIWGCKKLYMEIDEDDDDNWINFGNFNKSGIWQFDKNRIKNELELRIEPANLCPVFNGQRVFDILDKLPNIDPKSNDNWEYRFKFDPVEGCETNVAIGIQRAINRDDYIVNNNDDDNNSSTENSERFNSRKEISNIKFELKDERPEQNESPKSKSWLSLLFKR